MPMIESPCTKICRLDFAQEVCVGCGRTLSEIGAWGEASDAERAAILARLPARLSAMNLRPPVSD